MKLSSEGNPSSPTMKRVPGFLLYAMGISVWMTFVSCCGTTYMLPLIPKTIDADIYIVCQQLTYVATFFVSALLAMRGKLVPNRIGIQLHASALAISIVALSVIFLSSPYSVLILIIHGVTLGFGIALGFLLWIRILNFRAEHDIVVMLFISSIASSLSGALFCFVSTKTRLIVLYILAITSVLLLHKNQALFRHAPVIDRENNGVELNSTPALKELLLPAVCSVVLVLVAPIVTTSYVGSTETQFIGVLLAQLANFIAICALAVTLFVRHQVPSITQAYCVLLPLLATALLISALLSPEKRWFVLFLGDACFCAISFLLVTTSCSMAKKLGLSTTVTYGLLGGCVYLARLPEMMLVISPTASLLPQTPFAVVAILLYILAIPAFAILHMRGREVAHRQQNRKLHQPGVEEACHRVVRDAGLSEKHAQIIVLMARGDTTQRISETLTLSENTVRTYRKAIYEALDVHSKQELLDKIQAAARVMRNTL